MAASISLYVGILAFGFGKGLAGKSHGFAILQECQTKAYLGCIDLYYHGKGGVKIPEGGVTDDSFFNPLKSSIICVVPDEVCVLLEQLMQRGGQGGQTRDEGTEVCD